MPGRATTVRRQRIARSPPRLFRNDGDGTFTDVSDASGVSRAYGAGLGVAVGDFDHDGWPDIYVANDAMANQLWINRRDGTSRTEVPLGTAVNAGGRPEAAWASRSATPTTMAMKTFRDEHRRQRPTRCT